MRIVFDDGDVDRAGVQFGQPLVDLDDPGDDRRMAGRQRGQRRPDERPDHRVERADRDRAGRVVDDGGDVGLGLVEHPAQPLTVLGQPMPERGQFERALTAPPRPVDQRQAGLALEQDQLLRHGRGREPEFGGGPGDPGRAIDGGQDEHPARIQVHEVNLHSMCKRIQYSFTAPKADNGFMIEFRARVDGEVSFTNGGGLTVRGFFARRPVGRRHSRRDRRPSGSRTRAADGRPGRARRRSRSSKLRTRGRAVAPAATAGRSRPRRRAGRAEPPDPEGMVTYPGLPAPTIARS